MPLATTDGSVKLSHALIVGDEAGLEYWDEPIQPSEAGMNGRVGKWDVTVNAAKVMVDSVQLILRAPIDRMQRVISTSWAYFGDHVVGTARRQHLSRRPSGHFGDVFARVRAAGVPGRGL